MKTFSDFVKWEQVAGGTVITVYDMAATGMQYEINSFGDVVLTLSKYPVPSMSLKGCSKPQDFINLSQE